MSLSRLDINIAELMNLATDTYAVFAQSQSHFASWDTNYDKTPFGSKDSLTPTEWHMDYSPPDMRDLMFLYKG